MLRFEQASYRSEMDVTTTNALIGTAGSMIVAVTALILNYRGFVSIDSRFGSIERRLDRIEDDLKDFNKTMIAVELDLSKVKDRIGL
jgi:hypothetical protein